MLGEHRIHFKLAEVANEDVKTIVAAMRAMYDDFCQGAEQEDDVTLLAVRF